jgi:hypothetical protein
MARAASITDAMASLALAERVASCVTAGRYTRILLA